MNAWRALLAGLFLLNGALPAHAILPAAPETEETAAPEEPAQEISDIQDEGADQRIANRIRGFFAEIPAFADISVRVEEGVVTLSGTVADADDIDRAEAIAGRVRGVVTVENSVERDISVDSALGGVSSIGDRVQGLLAMLPLIAVALGTMGLIILVGYLLASFTGLWHRIAPNTFLAELIASAIRFIAVVLGVVVGLDIIGAGALMGAVLGGAGVIGIALGFALRDTIENYVASLMLSLRQPFRANDHVVIDTFEGRVIRLTSRATVLMTLDGNHLRIPNSTVFNGTILNYTRNPQRRFDFMLGVDADDDAEAARQLGRTTLRGLDFVLDQPAAEVRITEVGDSNVVLQFLGWIDQRHADWYKAKTRAIAACKVALEEAGFALPEPIYRLRFDQRTASLPFENVGPRAADSEGSTPAPAPAPAPRPPAPSSPVATPDEDVRPDDEIFHMVESERRTGEGEQADDLLDHARPVE